MNETVKGAEKERSEGPEDSTGNLRHESQRGGHFRKGGSLISARHSLSGHCPLSQGLRASPLLLSEVAEGGGMEQAPGGSRTPLG